MREGPERTRRASLLRANPLVLPAGACRLVACLINCSNFSKEGFGAGGLDACLRPVEVAVPVPLPYARHGHGLMPSRKPYHCRILSERRVGLPSFLPSPLPTVFDNVFFSEVSLRMWDRAQTLCYFHVYYFRKRMPAKRSLKIRLMCI